MDKTQAINNASFYFSKNMLKILFDMDLLTNKEYNKISEINAEYYSQLHL
ncbi:MAG: SHOCT domain-containing protein [Eubacterium sp.]